MSHQLTKLPGEPIVILEVTALNDPNAGTVLSQEIETLLEDVNTPVFLLVDFRHLRAGFAGMVMGLTASFMKATKAAQPALNDPRIIETIIVGGSAIGSMWAQAMANRQTAHQMPAFEMLEEGLSHARLLNAGFGNI